MMKRPFWLATGVVVGASGTLWAQRRAQEVARKVRSGQGPAEVRRMVERGSRYLGRSVSQRLQQALDAGRLEAQVRESEMWEYLAPSKRI